MRACPLPITEHSTVQLAHGSGGKKWNDLISNPFIWAFDHPTLNAMNDPAELSIDGSGTDGHSFFYIGGATGITFTFDAATIGFAPTYVGVAWTDGGGTINFEAFDTDGNSLGTSSGMHATSGYSGETAEDRFYGAENAAGIGSIHISNTSGGLEVDHLQFGRASADSGDCNGNSTPDKCELVTNDTDGNNIPDDCE